MPEEMSAHAVPTLVPADEHNRTLLHNVHPPDWRNPEPAPRYNLVVIGAGTAGLVTAAGAAGLGARVALVERYLLGGDCLNVGCVPSKCVIRSSRVVGDVHDAARLGVPGRVVHVAHHAGGADHALGGHAADVQTVAAEEVPLDQS